MVNVYRMADFFMLFTIFLIKYNAEGQFRCVVMERAEHFKISIKRLITNRYDTNQTQTNDNNIKRMNINYKRTHYFYSFDFTLSVQSEIQWMAINYIAVILIEYHRNDLKNQLLNMHLADEPKNNKLIKVNSMSWN